MKISFFLLCRLLQERQRISLDIPAKDNSPLVHAIRLHCSDKPEQGVVYVRAAGEGSELFGKGLPTIATACDLAVLHDVISSLFEELSNWDANLQKASWMPDAIPQIITIAGEQVPHPMYVADPGYKIYAMSDHPDMRQMSYSWRYAADQGYLPLDIMLNLYESEELRKSKYSNQARITSSDHFYTRFTNYVVKKDKVVYGHFFVIEISQPFKDYEIELIQMIGDTIRQALTRDTQFSSISGSLYEHFFIDVLEGTLTNAARMYTQLEALKLSDTWRFGVLRIEAAEYDTIRLRSLCNVVEEQVKNTLTVFHRQGVTAVVHLSNEKSFETFLREVEVFLRAIKLNAGMSDLFENFQQLPVGFNQAVAGLQCTDKKNVAQLVHFSDVAYSHFVSQSAKNIASEEYIHPGLTELREYDRENGAQLMDTLRCYLENDRMAGDTADQLFIHRNTLVKRLDKIQLLGDIDLGHYETIKRLILSFELLNASN